MATIQVQESVFAQLTAQAERLGLSLEAYLERLAGLQSSGQDKLPRPSGEELERLLDAESSSEDE